ncbi:MAG TPA: radical SAM family heme chaperone HemW [Pseudomonadales bacterium]|nr:radical SAM family heme chaperone HemW [Pseudomonadales bacterium]
MSALPLSLYVHFPWCVRKCPYCDFNSHPAKGPLPEDTYVEQLLRDLDADLVLADGRAIGTIFLGGGTPSLFSGRAIATLLDGVRARATLATGVEITLEANPGAIDEAHFVAYRSAGVNRLSIGAQSFDATQLRALGRIHEPGDIERAFAAATRAGFERVNLDLMHGLPGQSAGDAREDLERAIALGPSHLSWYQLTIEPRTEFALHPPTLPGEDALEAIECAGFDLLASAGYERYEVSAFARCGHRAQHNVNYWTFGDYIGIGAGAHGKVTLDSTIVRTKKPPAPSRYLGTDAHALRDTMPIDDDALAGEFMLNALRLIDGVEPALFEARTGRSIETIEPTWRRLRELGLMRADRLAVTATGLRYLDSVVSEFL